MEYEGLIRTLEACVSGSGIFTDCLKPLVVLLLVALAIEKYLIL